jgi:hypothetical protein
VQRSRRFERELQRRAAKNTAAGTRQSWPFKQIASNKSNCASAPRDSEKALRGRQLMATDSALIASFFVRQTRQQMAAARTPRERRTKEFVRSCRPTFAPVIAW